MRIRPDFWTGAERICWLCVLMDEFIGVKSLASAPIVLSGMTSIYDAPQLRAAKQAIFNFRQISLAYVTEQSIKHAVSLYNDFHYARKTHGVYEIDAETLNFQRTDPLEHGSISKAREILQEPIAYEMNRKNIADLRQAMTVSLGDESNSIRIPIAPIDRSLPERRTHELARVPNSNIRIPLSELLALAIEMDEREAVDPELRRGNWTSRFDRIMLMVPSPGEGLREENAIELAGVEQLIGLPGSGKTTLLVLIAVWLGKKGYKAMFIFPSIEVSRQYLAILEFHQVKVGMLVGQSEQTRRRHADKMAESIAAIGGNGGFAHTLPGADLYSLNCVLPAFSTGDTSMWPFGYAPCSEILQGESRPGKLKQCLCPLWTTCGRNQAPRGLISADIWVGHIRSLDTDVPAHAIPERLRYFELIARTFDVVVFDEADMVQSTLDDYGAATLKISGAENSFHREILEQIHNRFARGDNHRLADRDVELYSRDLAEFGNHNNSLIATVQNIRDSRVGDRYQNQLLTVLRIVSELVAGFKRKPQEEDSERDNLKSRSQTLTIFWEDAAYHAFYNRTEIEPVGESHPWTRSGWCARTMGIRQENLEKEWSKLVLFFRRYLAENSLRSRDKIIEEIANLFLQRCFPDRSPPSEAPEALKLLVSVTFMVLGYQRIVSQTRAMVAEGLIRDSTLSATASLDLRRTIPQSLLGALSGVRYSFLTAQTTRTSARNVELDYISFIGTPRMLMHRFDRLFAPDGQQASPAVLMTSATSFLEASPAYHIDAKPRYILKSRDSVKQEVKSKYYFKWIPDRDRGDEPLRFSGAGDMRDRNLQKIVDALVSRGKNSEVNKAILNFDVRECISRKAAFVVNSFAQVRSIVNHIKTSHPEIGRRTKGVVGHLEIGEQSTDFITSAQCEAIGDDDTCDLLIFPMLAIGRGVNIVFTKGARKLDAAIGSIYFLTRPHPTTDDMKLLYSLAGQKTQEFDRRIFTETDDLASISQAWQTARKDLWKYAYRLLREPVMASQLGAELFKPFTANQMVAILQTIGRGMRNGCPVAVYFVDAAWAIQSSRGEVDSVRGSMLVQMRSILEECVNSPDPVNRAIYRELYESFLEPLRQIEGVNYPEEMRSIKDDDTEEDIEEFSPFLEL